MMNRRGGKRPTKWEQHSVYMTDVAWILNEKGGWEWAMSFWSRLPIVKVEGGRFWLSGNQGHLWLVCWSRVGPSSGTEFRFCSVPFMLTDWP